MNRATVVEAIVIGLVLVGTSLEAAVVPFTEDFTTNAANWADNSAMNLLNHVATGGPDGGAYASATKSLLNLGGMDVVMFRAQDEFNSSSHAFEGNWISQNVGEFSAYVRHNAPMPLNYFTRFSSPLGFPGGIAVKFAPVLPNTWTLLKFNIRPDNPEFVSFEGTSFNSVFSNVGHIQVGVSVPAALGSSANPLVFDIDKASITQRVPEPASWVSAALAITAFFVGRRRRISA